MSVLLLCSCSTKVALKAATKDKGELEVHVRDGDSGTALHEATVSIEDQSLSLETDASGTAKFTALEPGTYSITVYHPFLRTEEVKDIVIQAGFVTEREVELSSNARLGD